ncbi:MAG: DEAD/DEAH box helicase [Ruminococcus sp.]|nr:DEAD/DEAH box helicase [Ruminococcus sp.]
MKYEPFEYQAFTKQFIISHSAAGVFLDMGMGKTVITLTAISELLQDYFDARNVLVIAPLKPAEDTWPAEIKKWDHLKDLTYSLVLGSQEARIRALDVPADIYIINRENVVWLVNYFKRDWPFDMVVIDELSSFKSSKAQRFRALKRVRPYIHRIVGLTGTPAPNGLLDLWPQAYLLDEGKALGRTLTGYREEYFLPDKRNGHIVYSWKPRLGATKEIYKKLSGLCISLDSKEYLDLPERRFVRHEFALSEKAKETYKKLEKEAILPFADGDIDGATAAVLRSKLLQLAGGAVYDENGVAKDFHDEKLQVLDQLIEEANGQPVLVFYNYKHELRRILARYPEAVSIKDEGAVARWNRGEIPILLAHPASAGHGLNLQEGGHIIIWYGPTNNLEYYQQANKRLHRPGQKQVVLIHHILAKDTLDAAVLDSTLLPKEEQQNALLEAVKARIQEVQK